MQARFGVWSAEVAKRWNVTELRSDTVSGHGVSFLFSSKIAITSVVHPEACSSLATLWQTCLNGKTRQVFAELKSSIESMYIMFCCISTASWSVDEDWIEFVRAPTEFIGNRLASYGQHLTYSVRSQLHVSVNFTGKIIAALIGNGIVSIRSCSIQICVLDAVAVAFDSIGQLSHVCED